MDSLPIRGIRGAVCVENNANAIIKAVKLLYMGICTDNTLQEENIISIVFSVTDDITALNPASALRKAGCAQDSALFCCAEPHFEGSLSGVIRILITAYSEKEAIHMYLNGAEVLRPDRIKNKGIHQ